MSCCVVSVVLLGFFRVCCGSFDLMNLIMHCFADLNFCCVVDDVFVSSGPYFLCCFLFVLLPSVVTRVRTCAVSLCLGLVGAVCL